MFEYARPHYVVALAMTVLLALLTGCCEKGDTGAQGPQGSIGHQGLVGHTGSTGSDGHDGANGSNGVNGQDGANGSNGSNGSNGTNGTDATPVTLIKLCDDTPVYPSVFVEYGLCLNNELYGVYSANGGFLALLPPGSYTSNGIGSACNLVVGANCQVSH